MSDQIRAIFEALEFIESHLREPITVADIAAAAGYSLYHFIRTFNQTVQHTPYDYLMRRRLSEATRQLLQSERRVIDIALDFQFNNHETFTRAFSRNFGMPPTHCRQQGFVDHRCLMPALDRVYLDYLNAPDFEPPKLVVLDEFILAGLMTPLTADPEMLPALWRNLRGILNGLPKNPGRRDFWGICIQPQIPEVSSFYLAAVKIPSLESAPGAFVTKIIPAGDYLCLPPPGPQTNLDLGLTYLYHTFLPKSGLQLAGSLEIEHFGERREILIPVQGLRKMRHL
jgi:AraC family transcriptional regulator